MAASRDYDLRSSNRAGDMRSGRFGPDVKSTFSKHGRHFGDAGFPGEIYGVSGEFLGQGLAKRFRFWSAQDDEIISLNRAEYLGEFFVNSDFVLRRGKQSQGSFRS